MLNFDSDRRYIKKKRCKNESVVTIVFCIAFTFFLTQTLKNTVFISCKICSLKSLKRLSTLYLPQRVNKPESETFEKLSRS